MPETVMPGSVRDLSKVRESVCIHTKKIFDSCRDKDCLDDLRFYPTVDAQTVLQNAQNTRGGSAELLYVYADVEPVRFHRGYYSVDMRFYYRVTLQAYTGTPRYTEVEGLCVFDKRAILFGSEGTAKIFTSDTVLEELDVPQLIRTSLPTAVVEAVDPIVLSCRIDESGEGGGGLVDVPAFIAQAFSSELVLGDPGPVRYCVTLGQFTLVRLERDSQLLIPVYEYCIPQSECASSSSQEDPCSLFENVPFPVNEFFPPNTVEVPNDYNAARSVCENRT